MYENIRLVVANRVVENLKNLLAPMFTGVCAVGLESCRSRNFD